VIFESIIHKICCVHKICCSTPCCLTMLGKSAFAPRVALMRRRRFVMQQIFVIAEVAKALYARSQFALRFPTSTVAASRDGMSCGRKRTQPNKRNFKFAERFTVPLLSVAENIHSHDNAATESLCKISIAFLRV